ncbi:heparinase II/III domain-containing protein [Actinomadura parmotrematis]|uniref:Heparinase II/III-family protein n=1 Tax=Actinomadura parmotrematis TaxID=2864039 RepID=A0ABS7FS49_9ACTN|nr:heparinase II/III family protein [Actinomadura parmotrematis]MBW8483217.1 heparinase II/III-family protein [Actinomadura parmotrematis]
MTPRSWAAVLALGAVLGAAPACGTSPRSAAPTAPPTGVPCLGYNGLNTANPADQVAAGRFASPGLKPVRVANGSDVDWGLDPYNDRTWQLWLHSLEWLGSLIAKGDAPSLARAAAIVRDWLHDNSSTRGMDADRRTAVAEGTKFRLITMVCLHARYRAPWLDRAIARHAAWLADPAHYSGPWNHGTDESMILLAAGCSVGRTDLAGTGYARLAAAMTAPPGGARPAIDAQGANNEQSTHYAVYNRSRWALAFDVVRACGRPVPDEWERRLRLLDDFIAFQLTPAGRRLQIGESYAGTAAEISDAGDGPIAWVASGGKRGRHPADRARVYDAGYVMGRSDWSRHAVAYTARFGPGRYAHGQDDHMSLTFFAEGRDLIVPSGHIGYSDGTWRTWLRSPQAHSTLAVRGAAFDSRAATALTAHRFTPAADAFAFTDTAYAGATRHRSVLAAWRPGAMAVLDEVRSARPHTADQLWHLPHGFAARAVADGAVATAGRVRVDFLRIPLPGRAAPAPSVTPGWIAPAARTTLPAPVVTLSAAGTDVRMLTLIAPSTGGTRPRVRASARPDGTVRVETAIGGRRLAFEASADGTLRRLP